ncbi:MAG TPA: DNA-processing protein DprA, partial [Gemmatimonadaceae bacterium]|nr:DNA-processing protein DprA [Gemmatimonadaceae bacterium]
MRDPDLEPVSVALAAADAAPDAVPGAVPDAVLESTMSTVDAVALSMVRGVGPVRYRELLREHGSTCSALRVVGRAERERARDEARRALADAAALGARCLVLGEPAYPAPLLDLADAPPVLWALGDLALLEQPAGAIVGTRRATAHGTRAARRLAEAAGRAGAAVVSGLALGIDAAAHAGALETDGGTVAVLGTGLGVVYPRANAPLRDRIREHGLLLSELAPGDAADAGSFPRRNRIIAALARVTLVVEAPHRSGALITAEHALELGRTVAAVPGPIDVAACAGSNQL